ncbi:MAG: type II and III secretion system protein [Melioribacteraceae bacterium]|nr:type II and III secretion system protein [Melioribacteraceae bacterium]
MHYKQAFKTIVQFNNLMYEEQPEVIIVRNKSDTKSADLSKDVYAPVDTREVRISGIFFEANISEMRERGINWQFLLSRSGLNIGTNFKTFLEEQQQQTGGTTQQQQAPPDFKISSDSEFEMGEFDGTAEGLFKFFEEENMGEIIARPNITVRDGLTGKIQIGEDISIKQQDFAGNVIDVFVPTGTILEVTPHIYTEEGVDYVLLKLVAERSTATELSEITTRISKTNANTEVLMLDGERTAIGGLFVNSERTVRRGIPILKDLPWWFFGLRYLFGYDQVDISKQEVIILLEAEIIPSLKERMAEKDRQELIKNFRAEAKQSGSRI